MTDNVAAAERILGDSLEPISSEAIAARMLGDADRPILPYSMTASFRVGDRVSYDTAHGRLVGTVEACEFAAGRWRMVIGWDQALSPGLRPYLRSRQRGNVRLFYVFDPAGETPATPVDASIARSDTPSLVELLALDVAEHLRGDGRFIEWAGTWSPRTRLPLLDHAELERALLRATMDDGIAQADQVVGLMHLPGPSETGHGFATVAVNTFVAQRGGWIWGGPRDGGEWLPDNALAKVFALIGPPPLVEEVLSQATVPILADADLPLPLETFLVDETLRELTLRTSRGRLVHIVSTWERTHRVLRFDEGERRFFPRQARVFVSLGSDTSAALLDEQTGLFRVEHPELRATLGRAAQVSLERLGDTDTFRIEVAEGGVDEPTVEVPSVLAMIVSAFSDDQPRTARQVLEAVLLANAGDRAVVARIVAMCLATYECFESKDDLTYRYHPDRGHAMRKIGVRTTSVAEITRHSRAERRRAELMDREAGQLRLAERSPHWVRGHRRRLRTGQRASALQVAIARRHAINLDRGHTFVRPHRRASHGGEVP